MNESKVMSTNIKKRVAIVQTKAVKEKSILLGFRKITSTKDAAIIGRKLLDGADREQIVVCSLNVRGEPVSLQVVAIGSSTACHVDIKEIFKYAILSNTVNIIVFHNHPSGEPQPSREDYEITKRFLEAGKLLDIKVLDHIILGDNDRFFSMLCGGDEVKDYQ